MRTLVLEATRVTPSGALEMATHQPVDWTRAITFILHHRLAASLLSMLTDSTFPVPGDVLCALQDYCTVLRTSHGQLRQELFGILDALESRGITAIPFKGSLLGELLFGDASARAPGDLDLLVSREAIADVREVLTDRGYHDAGRGARARPLTSTQRHMYERFQCEYQFAREADDLVVEPHWDLAPWTLAIDSDYRRMLGRARPMFIGGRLVSMLEPADLLIALSVHGAKHHWQRLSWVRDIGGLLFRYPDVDLTATAARARSLGIERILLLALSLASDCAGAPLPPVIHRRIANESTLVALTADIRASHFASTAIQPDSGRVEGLLWDMRERRTDQLRYWVRTVLTPRRHHLELVALPTRLSWLYFSLKVGADFALVPAWRVLGSYRSRRLRVNVYASE